MRTEKEILEQRARVHYQMQDLLKRAKDESRAMTADEDAQWNKAERVAYCETGKTVNWYLTGTYRGALGMYAGTWNYGVRATGYDGDTFPEQVGIAIGAHPITGGWSGWGCGGA